MFCTDTQTAWKKNKGSFVGKDDYVDINGEIHSICSAEEEKAITLFGPILLSSCFFHIGNKALTSRLECIEPEEEETIDESSCSAESYLIKSIDIWPFNAVALSVYANHIRMSNTGSSLTSIVKMYEAAATYAHVIRQEALPFLTSDSTADDIKVFIEVLLLDSIGIEYIEDSEEELDEMSKFSFAAVEATSRFMASLLRSTIGDHDKALEHLKKFNITHRVHPNVWEISSGRIKNTITEKEFG